MLSYTEVDEDTEGRLQVTGWSAVMYTQADVSICVGSPV